MPLQSDKHCNIDLKIIRFTPHEVAEKLGKLNPNKSPSPDGIHQKVLRELSAIIAEPLWAIYSQSIETGILPKDLKKVFISPIFLKGSRKLAKNYRPVNLTSVVCKIMESLIRDHIMNHLISNELFTAWQHGFMKGHYCIVYNSNTKSTRWMDWSYEPGKWYRLHLPWL